MTHDSALPFVVYVRQISVKTELSVLMKKLLPVRFVAEAATAPELIVTCVPERVAVKEAILGYGYSPEIVVPPPVTATSLPHETVGSVP